MACPIHDTIRALRTYYLRYCCEAQRFEQILDHWFLEENGNGVFDRAEGEVFLWGVLTNSTS